MNICQDGDHVSVTNGSCFCSCYPFSHNFDLKDQTYQVDVMWLQYIDPYWSKTVTRCFRKVSAVYFRKIIFFRKLLVQVLTQRCFNTQCQFTYMKLGRKQDSSFLLEYTGEQWRPLNIDIWIYLNVPMNMHTHLSKPNKIWDASEDIIFYILLWFDIVCASYI